MEAGMSLERLVSLEKSIEKSATEMDALIQQLNKLCPNLRLESPLAAGTSSTPSPSCPNLRLESPQHEAAEDNRTLEQLGDDITQRDEFLQQYLAYDDLSQSILDDASLSFEEKVRRLDALRNPFLPASLAPDPESAIMQNRITSLVALASQRQMLPKGLREALPSSSPPSPSPSLAHSTSTTNSARNSPSTSQPTRQRLLPSLSSSSTSTAKSSHGQHHKLSGTSLTRPSTSGLVVHRPSVLPAGMVAARRPVVIHRPRKKLTGAGSETTATPSPGSVTTTLSAPATPASLFASELDDTDLFDGIGDPDLILTDELNEDLEELLRDCIPNYTKVASDVMEGH
ncbi:hypothetical protein BV898_15818 [Hypsibius exemplaris]|uniref:Uncharacterized protein n=1 Tax=Hypsibius exemplaris TaxID=2072580 RepID=A0A9X6NEM3_HYPEX|nr:hypothetical protein BV898_15818 [Hypsibius exemplaris]